MSCCVACALGAPCKTAHFGADPGYDEYLGPLRRGYAPPYLPYGQSSIGQITAPFSLRAGVEPIGGGDYYSGPLVYAIFGAQFWPHAQRGRALARARRG